MAPNVAIFKVKVSSEGDFQSLYSELAEGTLEMTFAIDESSPILT